MIRTRYHGPDGTVRNWRLKEIVQGKPIGHPSHVMFVHFPVAFYVGTLGFDVASRIGTLPSAPLMATWCILAAQAGSLGAVVTGLVDWWGMKPGSRTRRIATRHMLLQFTTAVIFFVNLLVRWSDRSIAEADTAWIVLGALGVAVLTVGQYLGGLLVYDIGFRVYESKRMAKGETDESVA